jgi:hypothetical protein
MKRTVKSLLLCIALYLLNACGIAAPAYSPDWPALHSESKQRCAPPIGIFLNASERSNFALKGEHAVAPMLSQTLGVYTSGHVATHVSIELAPENKLRISTFGIVDGDPIKVGEAMFDLADAVCWQDRWAILTTPTHYGWDGADNPDYDPLFMVTMPIATMGVGALAIPLSQWWRFIFAVAVDGSLVIRRQQLTSAMLALAIYSRSVVEDDWFLYAPSDLEELIRQNSGVSAQLPNEW